MTEVLVLVLVAILPVGGMLWFIYQKDQFEREPLPLVLKVVAVGALSVIPTLIIGQFVVVPVGNALGFGGTDFWSTVYTSFVTAALLEESMKFLAFYLAVWHNPHFNEPFDAIVYCVASALGFAAIENIAYVLLTDGLNTGIIRAVLSVPGHAIFGVAMGYYMGWVKFGPSQLKEHNFVMAMVAAVGLHGIYDVAAFNQDNVIFAAAMYALVAFMWVYALRKIEKAQGYSPFRPQEWPSLPVAETVCPECNSLYPLRANYCHHCGIQVHHTAEAE